MIQDDKLRVERAVNRTDRRVRESLSYLQGHLSVLRRTPLSPEQRAALQAVEQSTSEILVAIEQLKDLVHASAEEPAHAFKFDLKRSLDWVRRQFEGRARAHRLDFAVEIDPAIPSLLVGDARRLRSILVNLLDNALRYTDSGRVTLRVQSGPSSDQSWLVVRFEVSDTGPGLSEQLRETLLSQGFEADEDAAPSLAMTARWVRSMGAELMYSSNSPKGSQFWFEVAMASHTGLAPSAPRVSLAGKRVLIVDQSFANRRLLEKSLVHVDCHFQSTASLDEALIFLDSGELPDAIILDGELLGGQPGEAAGILLETTGASIPLILLVPVATRGDGARFRELGCRAYLVKPLGQDQIVEALSAALAGDSKSTFITTHSLEEAVPLSAHVLLVTNEVLLSRQIEHYLASAGHRLSSVACNKTSLDELAHSPVELILVDVTADALRLLPDLDCHWPGVPRIGLVSPSDTVNRKPTAQGFEEVLFKPLRAWELSKILLRWAGRELLRAPLAPAPMQEPPVKIEVLEEATDGDRELQQEMISVFCDDLAVSVASLERALEQGHLKAVQSEAHSMKGSAPYFGADILAALAQTLEDESERGDAARSLSAFQACRAEFERIRLFFEHYLGAT